MDYRKNYCPVLTMQGIQWPAVGVPEFSGADLADMGAVAGRNGCRRLGKMVKTCRKGVQQPILCDGGAAVGGVLLYFAF